MTTARKGQSRKARQTQLIFSPLLSSSPASSKYTKERGERSYAAVRFEESPAKRRKVDASTSPAVPSLPTPAQSSQFPLSVKRSKAPILSDLLSDNSISNESEPVKRTNRTRQPQQGRLDFSNHIGTTITEESNPTEDKMSVRRGRLEAGIFGTQPKRVIPFTELSSDDELLSSIRPARTPGSSRKRTRSSKLQSQPESSRANQTRSGRRTQPSFVVHSSSEDSEDEIKARAKAHELIDLAEPETSGDDVPALHSSPTKKPRRKAAMPEFIELSSDEEEIASDVPVESDKTRRKHQSAWKPQLEEDEEEDEDENEGPVNRRSQKVSQTPRKLNEREQDDLNEDLDFLQSSPPRSPSKPKKPSARQSALEALKKNRRASQAAPSSRADAPIGIDDDPDSEEDEVEYVDNRRDMFFQDGNDEGFVVEDDPDDLLGAPVDMPLQFSNLSRMKAKDLFKFIVEWMVQKKINPAFSMDDEVYAMAFRKTDDEVKGLTNSKFTSSAWTLPFTTSLQARPGITLIETRGGLRGELALEHCEACNRSGHPATWEVQFYGKPYHPETLEDIDNGTDDESESDDDDEGEKAEYDSKDRVVPSADKTYSIGRFCKDNATAAHALQHWRYHLNEHIVNYLKDHGHTTSEKIIKRDTWSTKRRRKDANHIVDQMERKGKIRELYLNFKQEIEQARNEKPGFRGRSYA